MIASRLDPAHAGLAAANRVLRIAGDAGWPDTDIRPIQEDLIGANTVIVFHSVGKSVIYRRYDVMKLVFT